jgi:hypothetical protein
MHEVMEKVLRLAACQVVDTCTIPIPDISITSFQIEKYNQSSKMVNNSKRNDFYQIYGYGSKFGFHLINRIK